jgi:hypothetical protein
MSQKLSLSKTKQSVSKAVTAYKTNTSSVRLSYGYSQDFEFSDIEHLRSSHSHKDPEPNEQWLSLNPTNWVGKKRHQTIN